jgi:hypothetical protein
MNILILGCSFGVPDNGCPAEFHTENQLKILGHTVYNCARQGASNLASLKIAKEFCNNTALKIDWIVWFHTELIRDYSDLHIELQGTDQFSFTDQAKIVYNRYAEFANTIQAKVAVIGGAGPVHPSLYSYITPDFCIPSWFNEILNLNLPQIQTLSRLDIIEKMQSIGKQTKLEILQEHEEILNALEASEDFPDKYHPGARPHQKLAQRLHKIFTS